MIKCSKCEKDAAVMLKAESEPYGTPFCESHGAERRSEMDSRKVAYSIEHLTPEKELAAQLAIVTAERDGLRGEVQALRQEVTELRGKVKQ